jgi:replicative superfamily II helicase
MTLLKYAIQGDTDMKGIAKYIQDERIIAALIENKVTSLRPIQIESIQKGLFFGKNFLICTPSGSGKTLIGELAIIHNIFQKFGKGIYLVPYKAIATEKHKYFIKNYQQFGVVTALSIGDFNEDEKVLKDADIIVTTFEKLDSIIRNTSKNESWITQIATIVVDEVHVLGDSERGFKLESLIIRLLTRLYNTQMVCLSATIANPENFCDWLNSLAQNLCENTFQLIKSDIRPVKLKYGIQVAPNKDSYIRQRLKQILDEGGQVLIFMNSRRGTKENAKLFRELTKKRIDEISQKNLEEKIKILSKIPGTSSDLRELLADGIAYHNAGLLPQERHIIESMYNSRDLKVICCTTTLAAGINTPARLVILKDFKQRTVAPGQVETDIQNGSNAEDYWELPGSDNGYFIPFSNNETFQLLGRAGRPGLDLEGEGIILVKNQDEFEWVEAHYFDFNEKHEYIPKYSPIVSTFNKVGALREQTLLTAYQENGITLEKLTEFFTRSFFSYNFKKEVQLENYLLLKNIDVNTLLNLHADEKKRSEGTKAVQSIKIFSINQNTLNLAVSFGRTYNIIFDIKNGVTCSCGYTANVSEPKGRNNIRNNYQFCDHVIALLSFVISSNEPTILKYLNDILPLALKSERIIDYLIREGFLMEKKRPTGVYVYYPTSLGSLTIQLYLRPIDMIYIRAMILDPKDQICNYGDLIRAICKYLRMQGKFQQEVYVPATNMWVNESKLEQIVAMSESVSAGDFFSFKEEFIRVLGHFTAVARFFGKSEIAELTETLKLRMNYGVKEELLDLVIRIEGVGRGYGRRLYDAGFCGVVDVYTSNPTEIHAKTNINPATCQKIYENAHDIKVKMSK